MKIENKDFWEIEKVIVTQDYKATKTSDYEAYLYEKTADLAALNHLPIKRAKIFGCGTAREIYGLFERLDLDECIGTDISENMIKKGKINVAAWKLESKVKLSVCDATQYKGTPNSFDLVTLMNSILTYVPVRKDRYTIFTTAHDILKPGGYLIGSVHNQVGKPLKTGFFYMRRLLKPFLKEEPGNRMTGFRGYEVKGYYFSKKQLQKHLIDAGFEIVEVLSLAEYYKRKQMPYNKFKGWNNLIFIAKKT